jgi:hypothetical protein
MPYALAAGPIVALIGVVAVFFILRRKSVEKRSMYSARRSQIEHKVRAARQRTLAPHGHAEEQPEMPAEAASPFAAAPGSQATAYERVAYEPPPAAPPSPMDAPPAPPAESPWDPAPPGSSPFGTTTAEPPPYPAPPPPYVPAPEPYQPAPEPPAFQPAAEPAWTPAPAPSEPATPLEPAPPAVTTPAGGGASWSIVGDTKDMSGGAAPELSRKGKQSGPSGSWQLASGEAPGTDTEEVVKAPSATIAIAQYAILVVGLVMVLIGVLVMIANSHVS